MRRVAICLAAIGVAGAAYAVPPTQADVARLCGEAEGPAHCGRLVESEQLKRLPGLATRDGNRLRITLFPSGMTEFADVETPSGGTSYALWDYFNELNAVVLWTTKDEDTGFLLLQRASGKQTPLPAEPVVSPDRQRLATADFCPTRCENRLAVWRVSRDGVRRELEWRAPETWSDASVRWKDADTLTVEYTREGESEARTLERRLADPGWTKR
jgi:hypothetical protein